MPISEDLLQFYYSQHDKYSIRTSWNKQHLIENIIDLQGFMTSLSQPTEADGSKGMGHFQVDQSARVEYIHIVFLFTIFERRIRTLLKLTRELRPNIPADMSNYKGSFIDRVKLFLQDNLSIDLSDSSHWQKIMTLQKVRDCIIHCGGNINESRDGSYFIHLADQGILQLNTNGYLHLLPVFSNEMEKIAIGFIANGLDKLYAILTVDYDQKG